MSTDRWLCRWTRRAGVAGGCTSTTAATLGWFDGDPVVFAVFLVAAAVAFTIALWAADEMARDRDR